MVYGLVAPGYDMAEVLVNNLVGADAEFEEADMSTKLKLMGVDVANFGDATVKVPYLAHYECYNGNPRVIGFRVQNPNSNPDLRLMSLLVLGIEKGDKVYRCHCDVLTRFVCFALKAGETVAIVKDDPIGGVYRKLVFSADGSSLVGGILVGDAADYQVCRCR